MKNIFYFNDLVFVVLSKRIFLIAVILQINCAVAFTNEYHQQVTKVACAFMVNEATADVLVEHSLDGDLHNSYKYGFFWNSWDSSAAHFDNCTWYEGIQWIAKYRSLAIASAINNPEDPMVWFYLGLVTHATQDFYAHSNWVENVGHGQIATLEPGSIKPAWWISGTYDSDFPKICTGSGIRSHDDLNKDKFGRSGFREAFTDATLATMDQFVRFKNAVSASPNGASILAQLGFRDMPSSYIDAAVSWPNNKIYFFIDNEYFRYNLKSGDEVDAGYPTMLNCCWPGLAPPFSAIDAAFVSPNAKKAYFFSGAFYSKYDIASDKVEAGYPKAMSCCWSGLSAFEGGIDAAFILPGTNKAYFFRGNQYIRYDMAADKADTGYPFPLLGNWPGLESFGSVDAAFSYVDSKGQIKIYFFKGDQYIRYDWSKDMIDPGYPLPISGNWDEILYPY